MFEPRFIPVADHAVLVELGDAIDDSVTQRVQALDRAIVGNPPNGLLEVTPAFVNLLVLFDPLLTDHASIISAVEPLLTHDDGESTPVHLHTIDVCYEAPFAPDIEAVVQKTGLAVEAVIAAHLGASFTVGMYGFAPGYAYLSGTPETIQVPRKNSPIRDVPVGSVMIAGPQCLITTLDMPTGWSIIGRSPTTILRNESDKPFLFDVGDQVRFRQISSADYHRLIDDEGNG